MMTENQRIRRAHRRVLHMAIRWGVTDTARICAARVAYLAGGRRAAIGVLKGIGGDEKVRPTVLRAVLKKMDDDD